MKFHDRSTSGFRDTKKKLRRFIALCTKTDQARGTRLSPFRSPSRALQVCQKSRKLNYAFPQKSRLKISKKLRVPMQIVMMSVKRETESLLFFLFKLFI